MTNFVRPWQWLDPQLMGMSQHPNRPRQEDLTGATMRKRAIAAAPAAFGLNFKPNHRR